MLNCPNKTDFPFLQTAWAQRLGAVLGADNIRFVGGCVRDSLLGRTVNDYDACTPLLPLEAMIRLEKADIKVIPTGLKHGTITVFVDSQKIELTTLRRDVETDGRRAEVEFTDNWAEDAQRRDFTINALYVGIDGTLYDPTCGVDDLMAGTVRFIGDAAERIKEDALRILRFFRFSQRYSSDTVQTEGKKACQQHLSLLATLSKERIRDEFLKILTYADPQQMISLLYDLQVMPYILPEELLESSPRPLEAHMSQTVRLLCLLKKDKDAIKAAAKELRLSNKDRDQLLTCYDAREVLAAGQHKQALVEAIYYYGKMAVQDALDLLSQNKAIVERLTVPDFPLKGQDLVDAGYQAGPAIGKRMKALERQWLASHCRLTKEELLQSL